MPMTKCLTVQELECLVREGRVESVPQADDHLQSCETCRRQVRKVRANLEMLGTCLEFGADFARNVLINASGTAQSTAAPDVYSNVRRSTFSSPYPTLVKSIACSMYGVSRASSLVVRHRHGLSSRGGKSHSPP